jgi:hypothetical protein
MIVARLAIHSKNGIHKARGHLPFARKNAKGWGAYDGWRMKMKNTGAPPANTPEKHLSGDLWMG